MGLVQNVVRWYKLNHGVGKQMLDRGAELLSCPHCHEETPIFRSSYDSLGNPLSFSVCLWCDGLVEYSDGVSQPHAPYATARDLQGDRPES
ncbi:hypothetical protein Htur_4550 (plasmid) [Haloterrigena turkmenica DSM 5511]|uniref:Uncharacterized protein n=1 Tax=Haloterrigena turkmenica (strain ATCC 51198 / DSM 5511 / JCM 9101 / NCIMB 13204 / VKM B-1734 / 4k) TaxID=543526 RepID=D2S1V4_HALTV|nr:hypothetical protein Htur_4550 [Haloterrigena turkmenica DSM 5511]